MKILLLLTLVLTLILCITSSSPQGPDFEITPMVFVKLVGPTNNDESVLQIFPLNSDLNIEWTSEGVKRDPIVLIQVYYIFPSNPKETYVPLLKEPKESYLSEKLFKLKLDSNLFEADEKFYKVTVTVKNDQEIVGASKPFGVCMRC